MVPSEIPSYEYYWPSAKSSQIVQFVGDRDSLSLRDISARFGFNALEKIDPEDQARISHLFTLVPGSPILVVADKIVKSVIDVRTFVNIVLSSDEPKNGC